MCESVSFCLKQLTMCRERHKIAVKGLSHERDAKVRPYLPFRAILRPPHTCPVDSQVLERWPVA